MIELLLHAERALVVGRLDQAEHIYRQAIAADPRNSIAVVGLARVALERGDDIEAWRRANEALVIDPDNVGAQRLAGRLEEVYAFRGQSLAALAAALPRPAAALPDDAVPGAEADRPTSHPSAESPAQRPPGPSPTITSPAPSAPPPSRRSLVDRALRRNRR